jgi:hypothetical protein
MKTMNSYAVPAFGSTKWTKTLIWNINPASHGLGLWDPDHIKICYIFVMS